MIIIPYAVLNKDDDDDDVFSPSGFWTMALLSSVAKFDSLEGIKFCHLATLHEGPEDEVPGDQGREGHLRHDPEDCLDDCQVRHYVHSQLHGQEGLPAGHGHFLY